MNILYILPEEYRGKHRGGVSSYVETLALRLAKNGHNVTVLSPGEITSFHRRKRVIFWKIAYQHRSPASRFVHQTLGRIIPGVISYLVWQIDVYRFVKNSPIHFDIIEAPEWRASTLLVSVLTKNIVVVRLHRSWMQYLLDNKLPISLESLLTDVFERLSTIFASGVTSPTRFMLDCYPYLCRLSTYLHKPMTIITNGTDSKKVTEKSRHANIYGTYFLTVGRIEIGKGVEILIEAFKKLHEEFPNIHLVFVGENTQMYINRQRKDYKVFIKQKLKSMKLDHHIFLLSPRSEINLKPLYVNAVCYITASQGHENCSMALLDAISYGKAIIGSDAGGTKEIITVGNFGYTYHSDRSADLTAKMRAMLVNINIRKKFETHAVLNRNVFNINGTSQLSLKFYQLLLKQYTGH